MLQHEWLVRYFIRMLHAQDTPQRAVDEFAIKWYTARKGKPLPCPTCSTNGREGALKEVVFKEWYAPVECELCGMLYVVPIPDRPIWSSLGGM